MMQENEILSIVLGAGVLHFIVLNYSELRQNPSIGLLVPAFCFIFSAWVFSFLETFFLETYLNFIEHILYMASAACLLIWIKRLPISPKGS